jgi:hypothetical protein
VGGPPHDGAAQDGYVGSQINTLNAVGQVLGTQEQNVQAAEDAIQSTDYASATAQMSTYEILNQTGIVALARTGPGLGPDQHRAAGSHQPARIVSNK